MTSYRNNLRCYGETENETFKKGTCLFYVRTHSVPRSKHSPLRLYHTNPLILICVCPCIFDICWEEKTTRCHLVIYCSYELLYMFRALIWASSGHKHESLPLIFISPSLQHHAPHIRTIIVSSSWWWAYECPKHVQQFIRTINHQVSSIWFFFLT
jgi:hypothetical protein